MRSGHPRVRLGTQIAVLASGTLVLCMAAATFLIVGAIRRELEHRAGLQVLNIARAVARIPEIRKNLGVAGGEETIQYLADAIRRSTGAEFIVAFDMQRKRYSHPVKERIGLLTAGGDESRVLAGEEFISKGVGTLGPALRGLSPVYGTNGEQIGAVAAGVLLSGVSQQIRMVLGVVYLAAALVLGIGIGGSVILANHVKASMFGLEPYEIAALLQQRDAILESVREGIIAVDRRGIITLVNTAARRLLGATGGVVGRHIDDVAPNTRLPQVLSGGKSVCDREQLMGDSVVVATQVPMIVEGATVGALATFREKSEMSRLAEQLTGVKMYIESLRVQAHDYKNRLHAVVGFIEMGCFKQAVDLAVEVAEEQQNTVAFVCKRVALPMVAAILLGKMGRAKELGVGFTIAENSVLRSLPNRIDEKDFVNVIGNLVDNALEAAESSERGDVRVGISQSDEDIRVVISDTGGGVPEELTVVIWEHGFSTKPGGQGIGLALIRQIVESAGGTVEYRRDNGWTCFDVVIPFRGGDSHRDTAQSVLGRRRSHGARPS